MDQDQKEQEISSQDLVMLTNAEKDPLDHFLAFYEVLRSLGFRIAFDEKATTVAGKPLNNYVRVLVNPVEIENIHTLYNLWRKLPEASLFYSVTEADTHDTEQILAGKSYYAEIPYSWIGQNSQLIQRALKAAYLREAWRNERLAVSSPSYPNIIESLNKDAQISRQKAEAIAEPALDPEGLRIVIRQKMEEILNQHPELRPGTI